MRTQCVTRAQGLKSWGLAFLSLLFFWYGRDKTRSCWGYRWRASNRATIAGGRQFCHYGYMQTTEAGSWWRSRAVCGGHRQLHQWRWPKSESAGNTPRSSVAKRDLVNNTTSHPQRQHYKLNRDLKKGGEGYYWGDSGQRILWPKDLKIFSTKRQRKLYLFTHTPRCHTREYLRGGTSERLSSFSSSFLNKRLNSSYRDFMISKIRPTFTGNSPIVIFFSFTNDLGRRPYYS